VDVFWEMISEYQDLYNSEYARVEENIRFTAEKVDLPQTLIPEEIQDALINAVWGCPNGVERMLTDFPDTVETSSNLALVKSSEGLIDIKILVRSASETMKEALCSSLESVFSLAGAKVEFGNSYPGWNPNINSPILATMKRVHKNLFDVEPAIKVMHAGLECGIIMSNIPGLDVVSFGPTIKNPHSPDERVNIAAVRNFWNLLVETLMQA
jgi:dipeptidase D